MDKEVGGRIRQTRLKKGYTREVLSSMSGVSEKFIFQIERQGLGFSAETLVKLAQALDTSCDYLLKGHMEFAYQNEIIDIIEKFEPDTLEKVYIMLSALYEILRPVE